MSNRVSRQATGLPTPDQGQPPRALAATAVLAWTTATARDGTKPEYPAIVAGSITTNQVATMPARRVRPVAGCRVPRGLRDGRITWSGPGTGGIWLVTG